MVDGGGLSPGALEDVRSDLSCEDAVAEFPCPDVISEPELCNPNDGQPEVIQNIKMRKGKNEILAVEFL